MSAQQAFIATTRFGMGAAFGEISATQSDPQGYLRAQISPENALISKKVMAKGADLVSAREGVAELIILARDLRLNINQPINAQEEEKARFGRMLKRREILEQEIWLRTKHAILTEASFVERWVRFWSNHFTVSSRKYRTLSLVGPFEREAIRPNVFGTFEGLLKASTLHQAMLVYLDNDKSSGPNARRKNRGLNENLGRELLELHTLGVNGGYTQDDVTEMALALTGWTLAQENTATVSMGDTIFDPYRHEPGVRVIMGKRYGEAGAEQTLHILQDLAHHPKTAHFIATKLYHHFIGSIPDQKSIETLAAVFMLTSGDMKSLANALIRLNAGWVGEQTLFKTPEEFLISTGRLLESNVNLETSLRKNMLRVLTAFGQVPFYASSPKGWPAVSQIWVGADGIKKRLEWAQKFSKHVDAKTNIDKVLDTAFGDVVSERTIQAVFDAKTLRQKIVLVLLAPEFQRR